VIKSLEGFSFPFRLLGEHNEYFYKELLGLSTKEYAELVDEGVID